MIPPVTSMSSTSGTESSTLTVKRHLHPRNTMPVALKKALVISST